MVVDQFDALLMNGAENGAIEPFQFAYRFERVIEPRHEQVERVEINRYARENDVGGELALPFDDMRV